MLPVGCSLPGGRAGQRIGGDVQFRSGPDGVPVDDIVEALWGDQPPRTARNLVQLYVGEVRALLERAGHTVRYAGGFARLDRQRVATSDT
ncbi:hypothetical protein AB0J82_11585 [Asanoa sp. NPDC049518]|uniref:hypothetical protein n=1 Tax=unclassified Asanoa TaxID=2685164 RepID=UPI0034336907